MHYTINYYFKCFILFCNICFCQIFSFLFFLPLSLGENAPAKCRFAHSFFLFQTFFYSSVTPSNNRCAERVHFLWTFQKKHKNVILSSLRNECCVFRDRRKHQASFVKPRRLFTGAEKPSPSRINVRWVRWETFITDYYFGLIFHSSFFSVKLMLTR